MLMIGLLNLLLAAGAAGGLVGVCLVPRLFGSDARAASSARQVRAQPDRLAA
jgi:hypothetical protein